MGSSEEQVARVTIQEASYKLNLSQAVIRDCIRKGELQAFREEGPRGLRWVVELPADGWVEGFTASLHDLGIEEIEPLYLCGLKGDNVWDATGHTQGDRCTECTEIAKEKGLPLWNE